MAAKEYLKINGVYVQIGGPVFDIVTLPGNKVAVVGEHLILTGANQYITLPSSPGVGDEVRISTNESKTTNVVSSGLNINGSTENLIINREWTTVTFTYTSIGWRS